MSERPILLDLFCGAGGAAMGYHRAGFDVYGVDNRPQKRFPFSFEQADALDFLARYGKEFDAIHASPPCQRFSAGTKGFAHMRGRHVSDAQRLIEVHPDLIAQTRALLRNSGVPWIMENVVGAPMPNSIMLCGTMFGLRVFRHRLFESSHVLLMPMHSAHAQRVIPSMYRERMAAGGSDALWASGAFISVAGEAFKKRHASEAMGIDWMTCAELCNAIPPAYTEFLGAQILTAVESRAAA